MPLLLITGHPSCGKSTICERIVAYFEEHHSADVDLHVVSDEGIESNFSRSIYGDFRKEKETRCALRAAVHRLLHKKSLVICDSLNHIKGYRYELYCLAKNTQTRYAVLHCKASFFTCNWLNAQRKDDNERYTDAILSNLFKQFEVPNPKNRWDAPLFEVQIGAANATKTENRDEFELEKIEEENCLTLTEPFGEIDEAELSRSVNLPLEQLYATLVKGKELSANKCMKVQTPMVSSTFLVELDRQTQLILNNILSLQRSAIIGDKLTVLDGERGQRNMASFGRLRSLPQLSRLRQQFLAYMKVHPVDDFDRIGPLFIDYLNLNP